MKMLDWVEGILLFTIRVLRLTYFYTTEPQTVIAAT